MHIFSGKNVLPPKLTELLRLWEERRWEHTEVTGGKGVGGKPVSKTLNVSVAILNLMRRSTGSQ